MIYKMMNRDKKQVKTAEKPEKRAEKISVKIKEERENAVKQESE